MATRKSKTPEEYVVELKFHRLWNGDERRCFFVHEKGETAFFSTHLAADAAARRHCNKFPDVHYRIFKITEVKV